ncbi:MAG: MarR family winged helix-turn-helix transcriptional regulator [Candidatus Dormibacteria bacterium]
MQTSVERTTTDPPLLAEELAAWQAFLRAHTVITRALERQLIAAHRLPLAEYDVLVQLRGAEGGALRMAQLADRVLLSRSGLTRLVERLERNGLVHRQACPSDARGAYAVITESGRELLEAASPGHLQAVHAHFVEPLARSQIEPLQHALEQLVAAVPQECASALSDAELEEAAAGQGDLSQ